MKIDLYCRRQRCSAMTLIVSANIRFVPIFEGVHWREGLAGSTISVRSLSVGRRYTGTSTVRCGQLCESLSADNLRRTFGRSFVLWLPPGTVCVFTHRPSVQKTQCLRHFLLAVCVLNNIVYANNSLYRLRERASVFLF